MQVQALTSFAGERFSYRPGQIFTLPDSVDWLRAGLVERVRVARIYDAPDVAAAKKPARRKR